MLNPELKIRCFACGRGTDPAADSCLVCGVSQVRLCDRCEAPLSVYATTCPGCGGDHLARVHRPPRRWLTIAVPLFVIVVVGALAILLVPTESDLDAARRLLTPGSRNSREALDRLDAMASEPASPLEALVLRAEVEMDRVRSGSGLSVIQARNDLTALRDRIEALATNRGRSPEIRFLLARCSFAAGDEEDTIRRLRTLSPSGSGLPEEARLLMARAHWSRGLRSDAVTILRELAETAGKPETLAFAVETADRHGDPELGDHILARARKRFPGSSVPGNLDAFRTLDSPPDSPAAPRAELEAARDRDPADPLPLVRLADLARREGDRAEEIDLLSRALHLRPGLARLWLRRADAYLRSGWPDAAVTDAAEAVRRGAPPEATGPLLARANLSGPSPDPELALVALATAGEDPVLLPLKVRALGLVGNPELAVKITGRAADRLSGIDLPLDIATELAGIPTPAATALAERLVTGVLSRHPGESRARFLRALLTDRWEDLFALLADDPGNAPARRYLFDRLVETEPERARELEREIREIDADAPVARYLAGRRLLLDGNARAAADEFRRVLADEPRDREAAEGLRAALAQAGSSAADATLEARLGEVEKDVAEGRPGAALEKVRKWRREAIDAGPVGRSSELAAKLLYQGGVAAEDLRLREPAKDLYRASIRQRPDHYPALNNLALLLAADPKSAPEALRLAGLAARLAPGLAEIQDTLGSASLAAGDMDGAVAAYRLAVEQFAKRGPAGDAPRARSLLRLFRAHSKAGLSAAADEALRQAAAADPAIRDSADWPEESDRK